MINDNFDDFKADKFEEDEFDREVTRIPQHQHVKPLGKMILAEANDYLNSLNATEHGYVIKTLNAFSQNEPYFKVLMEELDQPTDAKVANDALNFMHFWKLIEQNEADLNRFNLLDLINTDYFQAQLLTAFDALEIGEHKAQRRVVLQEAFKLYEHHYFAGCIPLLYGQLEGLLTDVLIAQEYLKQNDTKFVDVYKIVPGLKGNEIKSLWHKAKIASELNRYFAEIAAYKMDSSSTVTMTRHNILHGTDVNHFTQERSFVLFIWLFSAISFMSTLRK
ncbi:hypothetical protein AMD27_12205 [Acinetobacter sp. TGL-Y2]|uniref:hypothetical protein n=1 Tax=Acinetobacter sp. TGL-Y2 TaxID=1407071 RepID=UPI0007A64914|nr:hypothetical protein [Acinetobacter sp. TGL-Y2]AMW79572.1 hypothetical protein AMD27_12205 [Acinetobacter sp. TGL-Y2]